MRALTVAALLAVAGSAAAEEGQKESGLAFEIRLGTRVANVGNGNNAVPLGMLQGGFVAGYKVGRILVGLGFDIARVASGGSGTNQPDTSRAATAIRFSPTVAVAALRSADARVELFAEFQFSIGHVFSDQNPAPNPTPDTSNYQIGYAVGPGLRFWVAPSLAFGGFVGVSGEFNSSSTTTTVPVIGTMTTTNTTGLTSIVVNLRLLGVFL